MRLRRQWHSLHKCITTNKACRVMQSCLRQNTSSRTRQCRMISRDGDMKLTLLQGWWMEHGSIMEYTIHRQRWKHKISKGSHTPCIWRGIMSGEWLHMYWLCCKHELYESMSGWLDWGSRVPNKKLRRLESPFCCCEFLWSFTHFEILHLSKNHSQLFMFYWHVWIPRLSNNNSIITILEPIFLSFCQKLIFGSSSLIWFWGLTLVSCLGRSLSLDLQCSTTFLHCSEVEAASSVIQASGDEVETSTMTYHDHVISALKKGFFWDSYNNHHFLEFHMPWLHSLILGRRVKSTPGV